MQEKRGGKGRGKEKVFLPFLTHPLPAHFYQNQTWWLGKPLLVDNANFCSLIRRLHCRIDVNKCVSFLVRTMYIVAFVLWFYE